MRKHQSLGLDELMIVNPSVPGAGAIFLGEDGVLYQLRGLGQIEQSQSPRQFFLGEDGILYQVQGLDLDEMGRYEPDRFFGDDGIPYETIRSCPCTRR